MIIKLSKYNAPFSEPSSPDVHYISLDDQRLMSLGLFTSHVDFYREFVPATFEAFDHIHDVNYVFESSKLPFFQLNSHPVFESVVAKADTKFLDDLYFESGIKAAARRAGRSFTKSKNKVRSCN